MPFTLRLRVEPADLDELRHVNNLVYVRWVQEAAAAHSAAVGLGLEAYLQSGVAFVVRRHEIDYLRPALGGDEVEVETRVAAATLTTAERHTLIRRGGDGQVLVRALTHWAFITTATGRPTRIPEEVRQRFLIEPPLPELAGRGRSARGGSSRGG